MRNFLLLIALTFSGLAQANMDLRVGSIIQDKETGSLLYFTCGMRDITGECNSFKAFLERPYADDDIAILPLEKIVLHSTLYTALLDTKDTFITGEPINFKKYDLTEKFFNKTNNSKFNVGNILIKTVMAPLTFVVGVGETLWDKPQNLAKSIKSITLKAKYKKPLKRLFVGKTNKAYSMRGGKFEKLVTLIKNIK